MTFTDDDLKRLKEEVAANRRMEWPMPDCEAFIARLEAAEKAVERLPEMIDYVHSDYCGANCKHHSEADEALNAWRKAAGK